MGPDSPSKRPKSGAEILSELEASKTPEQRAAADALRQQFELFAERDRQQANGGLLPPEEDAAPTAEALPADPAVSPESTVDAPSEPTDIAKLTQEANLRWQEVVHAEQLVANAISRLQAARAASNEAQTALDDALRTSSQQHDA